MVTIGFRERIMVVKELSNLDVQPEPDLPPSVLAEQTVGLLVGDGMILFTGVGAILGQQLLDNAFGWGQDLLVGAAAGATFGILGGMELVHILAGRLRRKEA